MKDKLSLRLLKSICEISYFVSIRPDVHSTDLIASVSDCLEALWQDGRLLSHIRHNLQHANLWLPILQACKTFLPVANADADVRKISELSLRQTKERIPFRDLDLFHSISKLHPGLNADDGMKLAAQRGCLRAGASVMTISEADSYAVTHTIFYCTDFGENAWPDFLCDLRSLRSIVVSLAYCKQNVRNNDLRGEFALASRFLGFDDLYERDASYLKCSMNGDGSWSGPVDMTERLVAEGYSKIGIRFLQDYHTTIVCKEALGMANCKDAEKSTQGSQRLSYLEPTVPIRSLNLEHSNLSHGYINISQPGFQPELYLEFGNPKTAMHVVDWLILAFHCKSLGERWNPILRELADRDLNKVKGNWRSTRLILSARHICGRSGNVKIDEAVVKNLQIQVLEMGEGLQEVDQLVSVLLSSPTLDNMQMIRLRELVDATIAIKIGESNIEDCIDVCTSASIFLASDYLTDLECFIDSFRSEVLSFGFVACDSPESQEFAGRAEVALRRFEATKALCAKYPKRQPIL